MLTPTVVAAMRVCTCPREFSEHDVRSHLQSIITRITGLEPIAAGHRNRDDDLSTRWRPLQLTTKRNNLSRLLHHISPFDYSADRDNFLVDYQDLKPSFFKTAEFRHWCRGQNWFLHCCGPPRCGKTTFAAAISRRVSDLSAQDDLVKSGAAVIPIFIESCDDRGRTLAGLSEHHQVESVLRAVLRQLLEQYDRSAKLRMATDISFSISAQSAHRRVEILQQLISKVASSFCRIYLIMDAADQLGGSVYAELQDVLLGFGRSFSVLITSSALERSFPRRPSCDSPMCESQNEEMLVWRQCEECPYYLCPPCYDKGLRCYSADHDLPPPERVVHHHISIDAKELECYITRRLDELVYESTTSNDIAYTANRMMELVFRGSSGNFGQAKLILDRMINEGTFDDVTEIANRMPAVEVRHLNFLLFSIAQQQNRANRHLADKALTLVAAADRGGPALSIDELIDALKFVHATSGTADVDGSAITRQRVFAVTKGLLHLQGPEERVMPYHTSLISYLWDECPQFALSDNYLAKLCDDALHQHFRQHQDMSTLDGRAMMKSCEQSPFAAYAQRHIISLTLRCKSPSMMADFLDSSYQANVPMLVTYLATMGDWWTGSDALHVACYHGITDVVASYLERHRSPNVRDIITGATPAMLACQRGKVDIVQSLLTAKADFSLKCKAGTTALWKAVENQRRDVVELLLKELDAATLNVMCGGDPISIAMRATQGKVYNAAIFNMLICSEKVDLTLRDAFGRTILHRVLHESNDSALRQLLHSSRVGVIVNEPEGNAMGRNALMLLLEETRGWWEKKKLDLMQMLVEKGASLDQHDRRGQSILHYAVKSDGCSAILRHVLSLPVVDAHHTDRFGKTALDIARFSLCSAEEIDILQNAMKDASDPMRPSRQDSAVAGIDLTSTSKPRTLVEQIAHDPGQFFSDYGTSLAGFETLDIQATNQNYNTLLHFAVRSSIDESLVTEILNDGRIEVNSANAWGQTALHIALVRLYDLYDGQVNERDSTECGKLVMNLMIRRLLEDSRTDCDLADYCGRRPVDIAWDIAAGPGRRERFKGIDRPSESIEMLFHLIEKGARIDHFPLANVQQTFEFAIQEAYMKSNPRPRVVERLIEHGADMFKGIQSLRSRLAWQLIKPERSEAHREILELLLQEQQRVLSSLMEPHSRST